MPARSDSQHDAGDSADQHQPSRRKRELGYRDVKAEQGITDEGRCQRAKPSAGLRPSCSHRAYSRWVEETQQCGQTELYARHAEASPSDHEIVQCGRDVGNGDCPDQRRATQEHSDERQDTQPIDDKQQQNTRRQATD